VRLCRLIARVCNLEVVDLKEAAAQNRKQSLEMAFDSVKFIKTVEFGTIEVIKFLRVEEWKKVAKTPVLW
jgi:hypothetical protein